MGDDERRAAPHDLAQRLADAVLGLDVDARGGVVEDQDARVHDQRAGDGDALTLSAGQRQPALADDRLVAVGQGADERVGLGAPRGGAHLLVGRSGRPKRMFSEIVVENRKGSWSTIPM